MIIAAKVVRLSRLISPYYYWMMKAIEKDEDDLEIE